MGLTTSAASIPIGLGNIWLVNCRIFSSNLSNYIINIIGLTTRLYVTTTSTQVLIGGISSNIEFTIDELWTKDRVGVDYGIELDNSGTCTINNMYVSSSATSQSGSSLGGQLDEGNWIVNNLTIAWSQDTTVQGYMLFGLNAFGKLINLSNLGTLDNKAFQLGNYGAQAQWINTSKIGRAHV